MHSRRNAFAAALAGGALLAAAGVYAASGHFAVHASTPRALAAPSMVADAHADPTTAEPIVRGAATPDDEAALDLVTVRISTEPAGASVKLSDGVVVCASTPCAFDAVRGAEVALIAERGAYRAGTSLTPAAATDLHLVLNSSAKKPKTKPSAGAAPLVAHDDLKVPAMFR
jgi:hypothetical protein